MGSNIIEYAKKHIEQHKFNSKTISLLVKNYKEISLFDWQKLIIRTSKV